METHVVKPLHSTTTMTRCSIFDAMSIFAVPALTLAYSERLDPERLRRTLSLVLSDFQSFAGRLAYTREDWYIDHGAGVWFQVAERSEPYRALFTSIRKGDRSKLCPRLSPMEVGRGKSPLLAVRLTLTPDGSVLCVSWSHTLCDYHSVVLLLKAWALAYRDQPYEKPVEATDRVSFIDERLPARSSELRGWRILPWPEWIAAYSRQFRMARAARQVSFQFSRERLASMRSAVDRSLGRGFALCAHVFSTLRAADRDVSSEFSLAINYRQIFGLPPNLLGNGSDFVRFVARPDDGPDVIASGLRREIGAFVADSLSQRQLLRLRTAHPRVRDAVRFWGPGSPGGLNLGLTNVAHMGQSRLKFGSLAPSLVHASVADRVPLGAGVIFESPNAAGLTLDIALPARLIGRLTREHGWVQA